MGYSLLPTYSDPSHIQSPPHCCIPPVGPPDLLLTCPLPCRVPCMNYINRHMNPLALVGWSNKKQQMWGQGVSFPPSILWGRITCHCKVPAPLSGLLSTAPLPFSACDLSLSLSLSPVAGHSSPAATPGPPLALFLFPLHPACPIVINALQRSPPNLRVPSFPGGTLTCVSHIHFPSIILSSCFGTLIALLSLAHI